MTLLDAKEYDPEKERRKKVRIISAIVLLLLAAFFLWFFRDPERIIPDSEGAIVSAADGTVTDISAVTVDGKHRTRVSIFLNVFDVHVNRSPISGTIRDIRYRRGKFLNAMNEGCADIRQPLDSIATDGEGAAADDNALDSARSPRELSGPKNISLFSLLAPVEVFNRETGEIRERATN